MQVCHEIVEMIIGNSDTYAFSNCVYIIYRFIPASNKNKEATLKFLFETRIFQILSNKEQTSLESQNLYFG